MPKDVQQHWGEIRGDGHDHAVGDDLESLLLPGVEVSPAAIGLLQGPEDGSITDYNYGERNEVHKRGPCTVV